MSDWHNLTRNEQEEYLALSEEWQHRTEERRRGQVQQAKTLGQLTPQAVADFAFLHITDDFGRPITPASHHWLWLQLMCNPSIKKLLIIGTPESAKTTWAIAYLALHIGFYPEWPHIIGCITGDVAGKRSVSVRNLVESVPFRATFPAVQRAFGMKWNQDEWSVAPEGLPRPGRIHPTVFATGVGGSIIGSRARLLLADDILDLESTRTANGRELTDTWFHTSFLSRRMAQVGRVIVIGNAWHHDDTHARLRKAGDWVVCHMPLLSEDSAVYASIQYPETYTGEKLGEPVAQAEAVIE